MKKKILLTLSLITALPMLALAHANDDHAKHDHSNHDHAGHDHGSGEAAQQKAGPNGGRLISSVEPPLEFWVTPENRVQITFLNDKGEAIAPAQQEVSFVGGSRLNPTRLSFEEKDGVLVSTEVLSSKESIPVILTIKPGPDARSVREKFNLNFSQCPTCSYLEYACICGHD